ncbi:MAG: hypothetical protein CMJ24_06105 [Phycisphaerae bacterium]|nr:hypothetical protein [Phycisphaerae bacterium]|tara:strand:- start:15163 stop:15366 length:204 start_codon:yes stop_codon:yes gene_type:complete
MTVQQKKPLMRCLGEFFGNIAKGVKTDPAAERREVARHVSEKTEGDVTLRRTTIDEIEIHSSDEGSD